MDGIGAGKGPALTERLARWVATSDIALSETALQRVRMAFIDVLGCILAGAADPATKAVTSAVGDQQGTCRSIARGGRFPAMAAALIDGTAAHALDFDDNFFPPVSHASAVQVPALLALASGLDAPFATLARAYCAGLEVQGALASVMNPAHYEGGWHSTSTIGAIGTAAACARLLDLDAGRTLHALSLASSMAGGSKRQFGTMAKPVHAGMAAMHGVLAAKMAAGGIEGNPEPFEGKWGLFDLQAANASAVSDWVPPRRSADLFIEKTGLVAKLYPSCMSAHLAVDAILALKAQHQLSAAGIDAIRVSMPRFMVDNLRFSAPEDAMEARFSMTYNAAVAMVHGVPRLCHFTEGFVADPTLQAFCARVSTHYRISGGEAARLPWGGDCLVEIDCLDGRKLSRQATHPKGSPGNPMSIDEYREKFCDCAAEVLGSPHKAAALFEQLLSSDKDFNLNLNT